MKHNGVLQFLAISSHNKYKNNKGFNMHLLFSIGTFSDNDRIFYQCRLSVGSA